jgi:hypothetical protein
MQHSLVIVSLSILIVSCSSSVQDKKGALSSNGKPWDYLLKEKSVDKLVEENHLALLRKTGDLKSFKQYLNLLDTGNLVSIAYALDYIKTCIPADDVDRDSICFLFNTHFFKIANRFSDLLETRYKYLTDVMEKKSSTDTLKYLADNLTHCGADIYSTEGIYYLDMLPDYIYDNFKNRVSDGVREYWLIRKGELKEGFSDDASMLISFAQLYLRVKRWENFLEKYPNTVYTNEAHFCYDTYLETLMTGMDNTRVFDFDSNTLKPEVKFIYEGIIAEKPVTRTTEIITAYYNFLSRHNFKDNDSIKPYLQSIHHSSMIGVQPPTR